MNKGRILIVGAGLSGSVIANELANNGFRVDVIEKRNHVGGNVYTERCANTGIIKHVYGPHIFNTNSQATWNYVSSLIQMEPFINRVKVNFNNEIFSFPINLHTLCQFFKRTFSPAEARIFIDTVRRRDIEHPRNFEEQALALVGTEIYEAFFKGYTIKQWGVHPTDLPASILKRIPIRFNFNDNYYDKKYQGIPETGYTPLFESLLSHPNINVYLDEEHFRDMERDYFHTFYSGTIDGYFGKKYGALGYRTVYWEDFVTDDDYQGNAVINYANDDVPYTRVIEHKHFYASHSYEKSIVSQEFSKETTDEDEPYYPKRLEKDKVLLQAYVNDSKKIRNLTFIGRLGTYRYLDMDLTIEEAKEIARNFVKLNS